MLQSKDEKVFIHNHLTFLVKYHKDETTELSRIVGFEVKPFRFVLNYSCHISFVWHLLHTDTILFTPFYVFYTSGASINHQFEGQWNDKNTRLITCDPHASKLVTNSDTPQEVEAGKEIIFTYDVGFEVMFLTAFSPSLL